MNVRGGGETRNTECSQAETIRLLKFGNRKVEIVLGKTETETETERDRDRYVDGLTVCWSQGRVFDGLFQAHQWKDGRMIEWTDASMVFKAAWS